MLHVKLYSTLKDALNKEVQTPNIISLNNNDKILFIDDSVGETAIIKRNRDFITYLKNINFIGSHGGILATFNFDGSNRIGGWNVYNKLLSLYVDGEIYDIDDILVLNMKSAGSNPVFNNDYGSGSGYGSTLSTGKYIALPSNITGIHELEYVFELDNGVLDMADGTDTNSWGWFAYCTCMTSITIPYYVNDINCISIAETNNLKTINLDSQYIVGKDINGSSLDIFLCLLFNKIYFMTDIFSALTNINKSTIKELNLGNSITTIGNMIFAYNISLTSITLPETLKSIGYASFGACSNIKLLDIPDTVETIDEYAFSGIKEIVYEGSATGAPWDADSIYNNL